MRSSRLLPVAFVVACTGTGVAEDAGLTDATEDAGLTDATEDAGHAGTLSFECRADDGRCPPIAIADDPFATLPTGSVAPFSGYADPSIQMDGDGVLWLVYSWASTFAATGPSGPEIDTGVSMHLASSHDGGATWSFEATLADSVAESVAGKEGYANFEVSSLVARSDGTFAVATLRYFNPAGDGIYEASSFHFRLLDAPSAIGLATTGAVEILGGATTAASWGVTTNLSEVAATGTPCAVWTEPALFEDNGAIYLLAQCKATNPADSYLAVFRRSAPGGWSWVGQLSNDADAEAFGGTELTQGDLARARDGTLLLIVTPTLYDSRTGVEGEVHLGCRVLELDSLDPPRLRRDTTGAPIVRVSVTSPDNVALGPGACAYHAGSSTGLILVRREPAMPGITFRLHATGIHP